MKFTRQLDMYTRKLLTQQFQIRLCHQARFHMRGHHTASTGKPRNPRQKQAVRERCCTRKIESVTRFSRPCGDKFMSCPVQPLFTYLGRIMELPCCYA